MKHSPQTKELEYHPDEGPLRLDMETKIKINHKEEEAYGE